MTPLRQRMIEDLRMRGYSEHTLKDYVRRVARLAAHFGRSPEQLGVEHVREYLAHLAMRKVSAGVQNATVSALRFCFFVTLGRAWPKDRLPYAKEPRRVPVVLAREDVLRLIASVKNVKHRMILIAAYAGGLRVTVQRVLDVLATNPSWTDLRLDYPELEDEDVAQVLAFASASFSDQIIPREIPEA